MTDQTHLLHDVLEVLEECLDNSHETFETTASRVAPFIPRLKAMLEAVPDDLEDDIKYGYFWDEYSQKYQIREKHLIKAIEAAAMLAEMAEEYAEIKPLLDEMIASMNVFNARIAEHRNSAARHYLSEDMEEIIPKIAEILGGRDEK